MSVNTCRHSTSFLDFPCPRCAPGRWSSVGYEAGRRSGHGAKVPGAPSVRRRGGPAFVPHQAPLTPHIASHGSVSCRCSSSSSTSYGVWVPTGTPPRRCWSPCARCARHGRNRTSKRGSRTSRGQPFGGVGGFQVPARCAGPSPVSAAAHAVANCIRCSVVGSPCRAAVLNSSTESGVSVVSYSSDSPSPARARGPLVGARVGWRVTHNPEVAGSNPAPATEKVQVRGSFPGDWEAVLDHLTVI